MCVCVLLSNYLIRDKDIWVVHFKVWSMEGPQSMNILFLVHDKYRNWKEEFRHINSNLIISDFMFSLLMMKGIFWQVISLHLPQDILFWTVDVPHMVSFKAE